MRVRVPPAAHLRIEGPASPIAGPGLRHAVRPAQPSNSRTTGASARKAWPRWLMAFFSSGVSSAQVRVSPWGWRIGVVAEAAGAGGGVAEGASSRPSTTRSVPSGRARAAAQAKWAARCSSAMSPSWARSRSRLAWSSPWRAGPAGGEDAGGAAEDVDAEAGVVGDGGEAGGLGEGVGLEEGVLGEGDAGFLDVGDVGVGVGADEVEVEVGVGEDGPELGDLAGVAGGEDEATGVLWNVHRCEAAWGVIIPVCRSWSCHRPRRRRLDVGGLVVVEVLADGLDAVVRLVDGLGELGVVASCR